MRLLCCRNMHLVCVAIVLFAWPSVAQETVFRADSQMITVGCGDSCGGSLVIGNFQPNSPMPSTFNSVCMAGNVRLFSSKQCATSLANASNSFSVYRVDQVDALVVALKQQIAALQQNIRLLSDANDALTKRLSELEAKNK
jgi:hypothetical protein